MLKFLFSWLLYILFKKKKKEKKRMGGGRGDEEGERVEAEKVEGKKE